MQDNTNNLKTTGGMSGTDDLSGMTGNQTGTTTGGGMTGGAQAGTQAGTQAGAQAGGGNPDMLDRGVDYAERSSGHEQSHSTTEKISDGLRKGFKKATGKDMPVKDQEYR